MYIEGVPSSVYQLIISHLLVIIVIAITSLLEEKNYCAYETNFSEINFFCHY